MLDMPSSSGYQAFEMSFRSRSHLHIGLPAQSEFIHITTCCFLVEKTRSRARLPAAMKDWVRVAQYYSLSPTRNTVYPTFKLDIADLHGSVDS